MQKRQRVKKKLSSRHEHRRSWDESSDLESFDMDESPQRVVSPRNNSNIVVSGLTGNIVSDSVVVNIEDTEEDSIASNPSQSEDEEEEAEEGTMGELHHNDWEVRMLAAELKKRKSVSELPADFDESDGLLRRRKRRSDTDTDASEGEARPQQSRPRAASLDQHNLRKQQYKCKGVFKAMSFDRDKDQL
jgi:hypothetical protein